MSPSNSVSSSFQIGELKELGSFWSMVFWRFFQLKELKELGQKRHKKQRLFSSFNKVWGGR